MSVSTMIIILGGLALGIVVSVATARTRGLLWRSLYLRRTLRKVEKGKGVSFKCLSDDRARETSTTRRTLSRWERFAYLNVLSGSCLPVLALEAEKIRLNEQRGEV
jgi:hypothetical protein